MTKALQNLKEAQNYAMSIRPKVGGFPYLAEALKQAGVTHNHWQLPSCQSLYQTKLGPVLNQGSPLLTGMVDVPEFNEKSLVEAIRTDQAGRSTFPEFLQAAWSAGVVSYTVDFENHLVTYFGASGEKYEESYPLVKLPARKENH